MNPSLRSGYDLLPLGTSIHYHHRAGVARYLPMFRDDPGSKKGWKIVEGTLVYDGRNPELTEEGPTIDGWNHNALREMFFTWPQAYFSKWGYKQGQYNKTVMVWPDDGFGWIIGIMRKSIGVSTSGYRSRSMYGDDYEPGYHTTDMYVDLYVVKPWYEGTQYLLCPLWAVSEVKDDE